MKNHTFFRRITAVYSSSFFSAAVIGILFMFSFHVSLPILSLFMLDLGASVFLVGIMYPVRDFIQLLFAVPLGSLSDKVGRRPLVNFSLLAASISNVFGFFAADSGWALVLLLIQGISLASFFPIMHATIVDICEQGRIAETIGSFTAIIFIGSTTGPVATALVVAWLGFRGTFVVGLIASIIGLVLVNLYFEETSRTTVDLNFGQEFLSFKGRIGGKIKVFFDILRRKGILAPSLAVFFYSFVLGWIFLYYPIIASDRGLTVPEIAVTIALWDMSSMFLRPLMGRLSDRSGRVSPVIGSMALATIIMLALYFLQGFTFFAALIFLLGVTRAIIMPVTGAQVAEQSEATMLGIGFGVTFSMNHLGRTVGYAIMLLALALFGIASLSIVVAAACAAGLLAYVFSLR